MNRLSFILSLNYVLTCITNDLDTQWVGMAIAHSRDGLPGFMRIRNMFYDQSNTVDSTEFDVIKGFLKDLIGALDLFH